MDNELAFNNDQEPSISIDQEYEVIPERPISGFWRRLFALLLDALALAIVGYVLGLLFGDQFSKMGVWARLIGFVITMAYFGLLNSRIGNGQSLGKKMMRIRVVNLNGETISIGTSFIRTFILCLPQYLNGLPLPITNLVINTIIAMILFGFGFGIVYFYLFNRLTRQSIHDLICNTYVVNASSEGKIEIKPVAKIHYAVFAVAMIGLLGVAFYFNNLANTGDFSKMIALQKEINSIKDVNNSAVTVGTTYGGDKPITYVAVKVFWRGKPQSYKKSADDVAKIVFKSFPEANQKDYVDVSIIYAWDIGIASFSYYEGSRYSPTDWQAKLN